MRRTTTEIFSDACVPIISTILMTLMSCAYCASSQETYICCGLLALLYGFLDVHFPKLLYFLFFHFAGKCMHVFFTEHWPSFFQGF